MQSWPRTFAFPQDRVIIMFVIKEVFWGFEKYFDIIVNSTLVKQLHARWGAKKREKLYVAKFLSILIGEQSLKEFNHKLFKVLKWRNFDCLASSYLGDFSFKLQWVDIEICTGNHFFPWQTKVRGAEIDISCPVCQRMQWKKPCYVVVFRCSFPIF